MEERESSGAARRASRGDRADPDGPPRGEPDGADRAAGTRSGFMREALALARRSVEEGGGPFGAVVVRDGRIVARGTNRVTRDLDPTAHAEIVAVRRACERLASFRLDGCEVYASCEPCPMCAAALHWARPARVFFASPADAAAAAGFEDEAIRAEIGGPPEERTVPMERLAPPEAGLEFEAWQAKEDRVEY